MQSDPRFRIPNPGVFRASTVLFDSMSHLGETIEASEQGDRSRTAYGTDGTPTTQALAELLLAGEGGAGVVLSSSGLAAVTTALLTVVKAGDHLLMTDSVYGPARAFATGMLTKFGVETEFYDPLIGAGITSLIRPNTTGIWLESPGSHTFEIQDVPAIVAAARAADHRVVTMADNTYGSPGLFAPLALGVDLSVVALTKYWGGHSDVLMGAVFANEALWPELRKGSRALGQCTNADDAYLVARGARTVELRMRAHEAAALEIARRLDGHPRVGQVLHPAFPGTPGNEFFRRDFRGSNGLFSIEILDRAGEPATTEEARAVIDRLVARGRFGLGYSWGGYESLVVLGAASRPRGIPRDVRAWEGGPLLRLHIGLEPVEALWADLEAALAD